MRPFLTKCLMTAVLLTVASLAQLWANPPIYIAFHWHMHQPIYWPGESVIQTGNAGRHSYNLFDVFNSRTGPYTSWPRNAVQQGINAGLGNFGAQVSFSGSLIENLNTLERAGRGFSNWKGNWTAQRNMTTVLGNPRLDLVAFGYHHPLMPLCDPFTVRRQIQKHRDITLANFGGRYSKGMFPPENAFAKHMIPSLKAEGIDWVMVDNIHFDRACRNYPWSPNGNLYQANGADVRNPNPNDWVALNGLWAPTQNSAAWGRRPHYVAYTDPNTGRATKMIAVPTDRYLGNEDGRGGFGALNYENVMSQLESRNTDSDHPILIVLHHDGDNYGGGSDSYYNGNFANFVNWVRSNPSRFVCTTVQDYLERFPVDTNDVIHVEPGSWAGADNGDPEFLKWNGSPNNCYSPDRNSWGVLAAGLNILQTAWKQDSTNRQVQEAMDKALVSETSCYWYWDGSENGVWDSHPTRAMNAAVLQALPFANRQNDRTGPYVHYPQRESYNPGDLEYSARQASRLAVWTYAYDLSGLRSVNLKYRIDNDGVLPVVSPDNETYQGGPGVGSWVTVPMTGKYITPQTNPMPVIKAMEYSCFVEGLSNVMVDYYVEAEDSLGNVTRTIIQHAKVGATNNVANNFPICGSPNAPRINTSIGTGPWTGGDPGGGTGGNTGGVPNGVSWTPANPDYDDTITIQVGGAGRGGRLHWGVNGWAAPSIAFRPAGTIPFQNTGPAMQTPFVGPDANGNLKLLIGPFNNRVMGGNAVSRLDFVINYNDNTWDNNGGNDYRININQVLYTGQAGALTRKGIIAFPNPAQDHLTVKAPQPISRVIVMDAQGKTIADLLGAATSSELSVNTTNWASGLYIIYALDANGQSFGTTRISKQ